MSANREKSTPSGTYYPAKHEKGEYWYFVPNPLPPQLTYDGELFNLGIEAQRYLSELGKRTNELPSIPRFINAFMRKEAEFSCQIEGTTSSVRESFEEEAGILSKTRSKDSLDITNYMKAMHAGIEILKDKEINLWFIKGLHEQLLEHQPENKPGQIRTIQNQIGGITHDPTTADFIPPEPFIMQEVLDEFEKFLKQKKGEVPPLVKAALAHAQFETIHPFNDGNGRVGRLLITFQLYKEGVIDQPILYLSYYFRKHKEDYNAHLQMIHDKGSWENWLKFFFTGVIETCKNALDLADRIRDLSAKYINEISRNNSGGKAERAHEFLYYLFWVPITSANELVDRLEKTKTKKQAYDLIYLFEDMKIIKEITGKKRGKIYAFEEYLNILESVKI